MKIPANKVDDFIESPDNQTKGFLIYGVDEGLVFIRKNQLLNKLMPNHKQSLALINITPSMIKERNNIIEEEFNSSSLFDLNSKIIVIENADNTLSKFLENIFVANLNSNNYIIITSGDLDSKSTLRRFGEYNKYFASIPCYKDDPVTIMKLVTLKLKSFGFKYNNEILSYLSESFGGNRLIILSELDKLIAFKGEDKNLTLSDVKCSIQNNAESDLNNFINYFSSLDIEKTFKELMNLYSEAIFPVVIVRSLISYFMKLQLFKFKIQNGVSFDELATLENIFWKQKPIMLSHLQKLSMNNIKYILNILLNEECKIKGKVG